MSAPSEPPARSPSNPGDLPHPRSVLLVTPGPEDDERAMLLTAATTTVGCAEVTWARMRTRTEPREPWRDVVVVTPEPPTDQAEQVVALRRALPPSVFPSLVVVGRDADLVHPLVDAVVAAGRTVTAL